MEFEYVKNQFEDALDEEIKAQKNQEGQTERITDGKYLGEKEGEFIYSIEIDFETKFPDDTPISVKINEEKITGSIVFSEYETLILSLKDYCGDVIEQAELELTPWFLLEELKKRINEVGLQHEHVRNRFVEVLDTKSKNNYIEEEWVNQVLSQLPKKSREIKLNDSQKQALTHIFSNDTSFIWGPPGTGKTFTLAIAAAALVQELGGTVLVLSQNNVAIDSAILEVASHLKDTNTYQKGRIIRYGVHYLNDIDQYPYLKTVEIIRKNNPGLIEEYDKEKRQRVKLLEQLKDKDITKEDKNDIKEKLNEVRSNLADLREKIKDHEHRILKEGSLIGCTLSKAAISEDIFSRKFDLVIVDEVSAAFPPQCCFAASLSAWKKAYFGDFRQLATITISENEKVANWLQKDIYGLNGIIDKVENDEWDSRLVMLKYQHRMHPDIAELPSHLYYKGSLVSTYEGGARANTVRQHEPGEGTALVYSHIQALSSNAYQDKSLKRSRFNLISALYTVFVASWYIGQGIEVGIITPYNPQARLIKSLLWALDVYDKKFVTVATVHRFQGSQTEVVILDLVDVSRKKVGKLLRDENGDTPSRLLNVAITRSRHKFIAISDFDKESSIKTDARQLSNFISGLWDLSNICDVSFEKIRELKVDRSGFKQFNTNEDYIPFLKNELAQNLSVIAIFGDIPDGLIDEVSGDLNRLAKNGARVIVDQGNFISMKHAGVYDVEASFSKSTYNFGVISLDREIAWLFFREGRSNYLIFRIRNSSTVRLLHNFSAIEAIKAESKSETKHNTLDLGKCPSCEADRVVRGGRYGFFTGCPNWCSDGNKSLAKKDLDTYVLNLGIECQLCGGQMRARRGRNLFLGCENYQSHGCEYTLNRLN